MHTQPIRKRHSHLARTSIGVALLALAATAFQPVARAEDNLHGLINLEVSDHYITPRGLNVENQGVTIQPLMLLFWDLYSSKDDFINDVSLTTGLWNDWSSHKAGADPAYWDEIDPISGLTFKFAQSFQLDVFYTAFKSQVGDYPTSNNLDLKLTYHDAGFNGLTLSPYVEYFDELHQKATVDLNPPTSKTGYYFSLGLDPAYKIGSVKLELPTFINIVSSNFYQKFNGQGGGSGLAVFSTELKGTIPLSMPAGYGHWSAYLGVQYYHLSNDGLLDGNQVLASGTRNSNLYQFHSGITIFF